MATMSPFGSAAVSNDDFLLGATGDLRVNEISPCTMRRDLAHSHPLARDAVRAAPGGGRQNGEVARSWAGTRHCRDGHRGPAALPAFPAHDAEAPARRRAGSL